MKEIVSNNEILKIIELTIDPGNEINITTDIPSFNKYHIHAKSRSKSNIKASHLFSRRTKIPWPEDLSLSASLVSRRGLVKCGTTWNRISRKIPFLYPCLSWDVYPILQGSIDTLPTEGYSKGFSTILFDGEHH